MLDDICLEAKDQMDKTIEVLKRQLATIRTGRANVSLLEGVRIDYYGSLSPIAQVASISASDSRTLVVRPWDKGMLKPIEKAIQEANLGLVPVTDSEQVRVPIPTLTEERRKEFVKQARQRAEDAKIGVRNARRDANDLFKDAVKRGDLSEDDEKKGLKTTQEITDQSIAEIDKILSHKEAEIMVV
ncbi:MAG: ribosome recycling factor [Myxococcaceae bacterium]|nr:ribosome recycling factor [Myxococcaceae bacterium]MBH2005983.1 ribosome recycling factor [Myxococcaceae bacterium]